MKQVNLPNFLNQPSLTQVSTKKFNGDDGAKLHAPTCFPLIFFSCFLLLSLFSFFCYNWCLFKDNHEDKTKDVGMPFAFAHLLLLQMGPMMKMMSIASKRTLPTLQCY
jgi:hypothetical protein